MNLHCELLLLVDGGAADEPGLDGGRVQCLEDLREGDLWMAGPFRDATPATTGTTVVLQS